MLQQQKPWKEALQVASYISWSSIGCKKKGGRSILVDICIVDFFSESPMKSARTQLQELLALKLPPLEKNDSQDLSQRALGAVFGDSMVASLQHHEEEWRSPVGGKSHCESCRPPILTASSRGDAANDYPEMNNPISVALCSSKSQTLASKNSRYLRLNA